MEKHLGRSDAEGNFPDGTVNACVCAKLAAFADARRTLQSPPHFMIGRPRWHPAAKARVSIAAAPRRHGRHKPDGTPE